MSKKLNPKVVSLSQFRNGRFLLALLLVSLLTPNVCFSTDFEGSCFAGMAEKTRGRDCAIGVVRVPMNPSPAFGTNSSAPVIVFPIRKLSSYRQVEEAPLAQHSCGSAPVIRSDGNVCFAERSLNTVPYFSGDTCPKAPIIVSYPSRITGRKCD
ncbi:MAG: hypothetical protein V1897_08955 [Pseudomonadota bacterium]